MPTVATQKNKVEDAFYVFQQLNEKEKDLFFEKTRKQKILDLAKRLDRTGEPIEMSDDEIVSVCRESRKRVYEKTKKEKNI